MAAPHGPQRRAQTYDEYAAGPSSNGVGPDGGLSGRSQSLRYPPQNDPPLPSYDALMAAENNPVSISPQPIDEPYPTTTSHGYSHGHSNSYGQSHGHSSHPSDPSYSHPNANAGAPPQGHRRGPSLDGSAHRLDTPFAPVDYANPRSRASYDNHTASQRYSGGSMSGHHRYSGGGGAGPSGGGGGGAAYPLQHRPVSDPNEIGFGQLSLHNTSPSAPGPGPGMIQRHPTAPPSAFQMDPYHQQRRVDGSASVYSLDSGVGAYSQGQPQQQQPQQPYGAQPDFTNPYYSAANEFLGPPPGSYASGSGTQPPPSGLMRQNTTASAMSSASSISLTPLTRNVSESVGASSTRRRGMAAAIDVNKPPYTKQYVDDYRKRMKDDPDPEAQFNFAKYLVEAAKKLGDEISHTDIKLGRRYRDTLLQESLRLIKKLAEGKEPYPDAQFFLANLYGTGQLGLQVDHEKAYYLYLMASKLNHPAATYRSAVCNEIGAGTKRDNQRAVLFYRKAAALGDTAAMYKLGMILLNGLLSQPRNVREAIVWLRRAASQADEDNPHALHELAILHERPTPAAAQLVPHDPNLARELYLQAAQLGYAPAQFKLGSCHEFGTLGCPIDPRKSIAWYTRSAEKGDSEAELALSGWYLTGSEGVLKQSDQEAYLWGRKAANKGLAKAEYAVGYYCDVGIGRPADPELAKRWYQRAAAQGHKGAMQRLTELNSAKGAKGKRAPGRPTRSEAESECVVM